MSPVLSAALGPLVTLHRGERRVALLMFAYSFLAMTAWNILRPLTRSRFISDLGADNVPFVLLAAGVLIGLLMHQYTRAIRRLPRALVIPITQAGIIALLVLFWALLRTDAVWVSVAFYFLGLILGILLISQFWTLANDIYDARQAKRIFGFIGSGASLGGALGAGLTRAIVRTVGTENMILAGAAVLALCTLVVMAILRRHDVTGSADLGQEEEGVSAREALRLIRESRHLKIMALVIGFAAAGAQIIDQQLIMAAEASRGDEGAEGIAEFLAEVTVYLSLAGFVVQLALTRWIHRSFGLAVALLLLPVALGSTAVLILVTGAVWATAVARVVDATLRYTIDKTTREVLFLPLPADLKYRAKPLIDVTADRFAKAVAALVLLVLIKPWGFGLDWRRLSYASLAMMAVWIVTALVARREYLRAFRRSIGSQTLAADAIRTDVGDAATIEALVEELSNPDPTGVLYAIGMLETLDKRHLVSPLLLQHESPDVRARALRALGSVRPRIAARWKSHVERLVHDSDVKVRAAALRALANFSHEDALGLLRRHLADTEPRVVVTACVGLAVSADPADVDAAEAALQRLIDEAGEAGATGRKEAAVALAHIRPPRFRPLLVPLLYDADPEVVDHAIRSARALGAEDGLFLPGLISLLGHRTLKATARDALVGYGPSVVAALAHALADTREDVWVRRHIPATLSEIPVAESMEALVEALDDPDGFLRYKAIVAMERLRRGHPELAFPVAVVERLVLTEATRYYKYLTLRVDLVRVTGEDSLLARALAEKLARTLDRVYRLLGLRYRAEDVSAARYTIEQGSARSRAAAVEYLDNLLTGIVRKRVLPMLDETPLSEKLRQAYLVLKTRPRDLGDALAQLVHEEDPVVAAAAVHIVARRQDRSLAGDLRYLLAHRAPGADPAVEAAAWALQAWHHEPSSEHDALPVVALADQLRAVPLFQTVSIDELFRVAASGTESRPLPGRDLYRRGTVPSSVEFLLHGSVALIGSPGRPRHVEAPAVLGLDEVLQGAPAPATARALHATVCFRIAAADFLGMIANNIQLAEGLFRMLLADCVGPGAGVTAVVAGSLAEPPLQPFDQAIKFREHPLLARATPTQLLALIRSGREVPLVADDVLFEPEAPAALFQVLEGELTLTWPGSAPRTAGAGTTVNLVETLAGVPPGCRAHVTAGGRALRIDREELFGVLTDHLTLLGGLFGEALRFRQAAQAPAPTDAAATSGTPV